MYLIDIVAVGNVKDQYLKNEVQEYLARVSLYAKISCYEVKEESFAKISDKKRIIKNEEERIRKYLKKESIIIVLDAKGAEYSSEQFANMIKNEGERGQKIIFVIGGALGLSDEFKKEYRHIFSLSRLTFPHQLARIVLLEQLYRAMTILHGKQYHY